MHKGSDVDVLVEFEGPATLDDYMGLKSFLEGLFKVKVDLVTNKGLKPRARPYVERDLIHDVAYHRIPEILDAARSILDRFAQAVMHNLP